MYAYFISACSVCIAIYFVKTGRNLNFYVVAVYSREDLFWECLLREKSHGHWLKKVKRSATAAKSPHALPLWCGPERIIYFSVQN